MTPVLPGRGSLPQIGPGAADQFGPSVFDLILMDMFKGGAAQPFQQIEDFGRFAATASRGGLLRSSGLAGRLGLGRRNVSAPVAPTRAFFAGLAPLTVAVAGSFLASE